ncbi:MAG TPA: cysteine--tRNA ligase, partial [Blastocatellia bacterium]
MLKLYNTLTNQVEEFKPLEENKVRLYVCGPTVHDFAHIGNFRTFLFSDLLRRYLKFKGFQVHHVMNITDVDDKIIKKSVENGQSLHDYTEIYTQYFLEDFDALGAERPEEILRATDHIPEMVEIIKRLDANGHTYSSDGSTYFRINSFNGYGKLSKMNFEGNVTGASERVDSDEYEAKENARDFVLWKAVKPGEPFWETELGQGRPGWHIECSAMNLAELGEQIDIHGGGNDLIFPHHENEIAQSESLTGLQFARFWIHNGMMQLSGEKMSKSLGNLVTIQEFLSKHEGDVLRMMILNSSYRNPLTFGDE